MVAKHRRSVPHADDWLLCGTDPICVCTGTTFDAIPHVEKLVNLGFQKSVPEVNAKMQSHVVPRLLVLRLCHKNARR